MLAMHKAKRSSKDFNFNICFTFLPVLDCTFLQEHWRVAVCYNHVMYSFQIESTRYSCLNLKERLARNRGDIWNLSEE